MRLFHVTPMTNSSAIAKYGLMLDCAYDLFTKQIFFCPCRSVDYWIREIKKRKGYFHGFDVWELLHSEKFEIHFADFQTRWIGVDIPAINLSLCLPRDLP